MSEETPLVTFEKLAEIVATCSSCSMCRRFALRALEEKRGAGDTGGVAFAAVPQMQKAEGAA